MTTRKLACLGAAAAIAILALPWGAVAQPAAAPSDTALFPPSYFTAYNPVTASDMVSRIPGFELRDGDDRRGFGGTAGNLLINGERPAPRLQPLTCSSVFQPQRSHGSK